MLVFGSPACHPEPTRAKQAFLPEVNVKRCKGDRGSSGVVQRGLRGVTGAGGVGQRATKKGKTVRALRRSEGGEARGLILSSRTESPDSKRIFTL